MISMQTKMKIVLLILGFLFVHSSLTAQTMTSEQLEKKLDSLSFFQMGLNNNVQLNVSNIALADLLGSIGLENSLNLSVDPGLTQLVSYNFYDARVRDVFIFLYNNYEINIQFIGSIIAFKKLSQSPKSTTVYKPKEPNVSFNKANNFLTVDLLNDTLSFVTERITKLSGENIVLSANIKNKKIAGYFENRPFEQVMQMIARSNDLDYFTDDNKIHYLTPLEATKETTSTTKTPSKGVDGKGFTPSQDIKLVVTPDGLLSVSASNVNISDVIQYAAQELKELFFLYTIPEGKTTLNAVNISFEELLRKLLNGTKYTYKIENRTYFIGEQKSEGLRSTQLIKLEYRTIENVKSSIPRDLIADVELFEFIELNAFVVSGSLRRIEELRKFLLSIDQVVPMIQIDVIIMYSQKGSTVSTGIKAALDANQQQTAGQVFPGLDVNLSSISLNNIIDAINGFGILNLGKVTTDFFVSLQALESNNVIEMESTPKISTLNGHEANIAIGEERYYQQERVQVSNVVGNANVQSSRIWTPVQANMEVRIKPFVSADEHVTLEISVSQNDFGEQADPTAPPNKTTQTFQSLVRVKNGEVILMGGLEKKARRDSGAGMPGMSRIPVLKWFLSSRSKSREKSKLHILIRPTVTY
jgi:type IV pilus assembly protein PilQ